VLRDASIDALVDELERAQLLGLLGVVVHPGTAAADSTEDDAVALAADAMRVAFARTRRDKTMILIEHTAGQGRTIGHRFEHLAMLIDRLDGSARVGVCLDTCHLLASGYDIVSDRGYADTIATFDRVVGLDRLRIIHANDSKRPHGSRLDRHEHIGKGFVGLGGFRHFVRDPRLSRLAMVIETPKTPGICDHPKIARVDPLDRRNLDTLRRLRK
jgi:deoxyribonuclease-4